MKKILGIFALALALVSCGSGASSSNQEAVDSTAVQVDSLSVTANDSTTAQIPADQPSGGGTGEKTEPVK